MKKFWILTAVFIAVLLLLVPAIAFAEGEDSDTADSTETSAPESSTSQEPSTSDDSTTETSSTSIGDSDSADSGSGSTELSTSDSSGVEETSDSNDSTTETSSTGVESNDIDTADSSTDSTELSTSDSSGVEETSDSDDSNTGLTSTGDDATEEGAFSDGDDPLIPEDGSSKTSGGGGNSYVAEITPDSGLEAGEPTDFTVTFTEVGDTTLLGSAQLFIPDEFTSIGFSADDIDTSGDENWTGELDGQVLSLWAIAPGDYLGFAGWVSAVFTATTPADSGEYTFDTLAWTDNSVETIAIVGVDGDPKKVELGTAESFAILAATGVTVEGAVNTTTVYGDIGSYPTDSYTGQANVVQTGGDVYLDGDGGVAAGAQEDLQAAYDDAFGRDSTRDITGDDLGDLSTLAEPLEPGVYSASSSLGLTGTLYLSAENPNDAFIFQIGTTLTTASDSEIVLLGEATFCQVFWQVGSSATLGANSTFVGHILALTDISVGAGTTVIGQLLALGGIETAEGGAVTLAGNNTITNEPCVAGDNGNGIDNGDGNGNGNGTDTGTGIGIGIGTGFDTGIGTEVLGSQTVSETDEDSDILSGDRVALPATGGLALEQVFLCFRCYDVDSWRGYAQKESQVNLLTDIRNITLSVTIAVGPKAPPFYFSPVIYFCRPLEHCPWK